ncbi:MAG: hypothetical protein PW843_23140 [Azospirillaceae bacterium]|nr:hypothetical protein [Azospirillaceae bacterium]
MPLYRDDYGAFYWSLRGDVTGEVVRDTPFHKDAGTRVQRVRPEQQGRILWTARAMFALLGLEALTVLALAVGLLVIPPGWPAALALNAFLPGTVLSELTVSVLLPLSCEWTTVRHPLRIVAHQAPSLLLAPLLPILGPLLHVAAVAVIMWRDGTGLLALRTFLGRTDLWERGVLALAALALGVLAGWLIRQCAVAWMASRRRPATPTPGLRVAASRDRRVGRGD